MKRLTLIALASIGISILACGGADLKDGDVVVIDTIDAVAPTPPWVDMGLPTPEGQTIASDDTYLLVLYKDQVIQKYTESYSAALTSGGWAKGDDYSSEDFTAIIWTKEEQKVGLAIGFEEDQKVTFTYMEDLAKVDEPSISSAGGGRFKLDRVRNGPAARKRAAAGKGPGAKAKGKSAGGKAATTSSATRAGGGGKAKGKKAGR